MNLVLIFSYDAYNFIANEILGANWWAIIGTGVLALGFVVHIIYAIILTLQNKKARGSDRYASASKTPVAWSSKKHVRSRGFHCFISGHTFIPDVV
jgi:succinate dehydrogenase / fumarate reductase cytochrome b subunit